MFWGMVSFCSVGGSLQTAMAFQVEILQEWQQKPHHNKEQLETSFVPKGCSLFAHNWKLPAYSLASSLTVVFSSLLMLTAGAFCLQSKLCCLQSFEVLKRILPL